MPDPTPPPVQPAQDPSYSVEVPTNPASSPTSYLRVGAADATSARELAYFGSAANLASQKPGIVMWAPNAISTISASSIVLKTSAEALSASVDGTKIINNTYSFAETGTYRDVSYKLSHATSWTVGDSQTWKCAANADVTVSVDQKMSLGTSYSMKMGADVGTSLGVIDLKSDMDGVEIKSVAGNYSTKRVAKLLAAETITITVTPLTLTYLASVELANKIAIGLAAVTGAVTGGVLIAYGTMLAQTSADGLVPNSARETELRNKAIDLSKTGFASLGQMTVSQAAFMSLGIMGIKASKAVDVIPVPSIKMTRDAIDLTVGPTVLNISAGGISLKCGLASILDVTPNTIQAESPNVTLKALVSSLSVSAASISAQAPSVSVRGTATFSGNAPAVSFGP
jgi:hypothetical protein